MFWKKIKEKFQNMLKEAVEIDDYISNYGKDDDCDIDVKMARHNYEKYYNDLKQRQQDIITQWCKEIKEASNDGKKYILTNQFITDDDKNKILHLINRGGNLCDFPSNSSLEYFQQYFEERGFKVVKIEYPTNNICCLKIIWISSQICGGETE